MGVKLGRIQIFNNWSPYMVKDPEHTVWILSLIHILQNMNLICGLPEAAGLDMVPPAF